VRVEGLSVLMKAYCERVLCESDQNVLMMGKKRSRGRGETQAFIPFLMKLIKTSTITLC